jgi:hypothetical protein
MYVVMSDIEESESSCVRLAHGSPEEERVGQGKKRREEKYGDMHVE